MSNPQERRIGLLAQQLAGVDVSQSRLAGSDVEELYKHINHDYLLLREQMTDFLKDDLYAPKHYIEFGEFRELTLRRLQHFARQRFFSIWDYINDPRRFMAALETLAYIDYSLCIKAGVHYTLCGGTICKLGTKRHHNKYLPHIDNLTLPGCFGMTELGHGSNVLGIQTTATYDRSNRQFIINTPEDSASKFWIGGSAQHGKVCTVFAQLYVDTTWHGVHVFVVRIRDDQGLLMPGVTIVDNGAKMGLNGVDNGQIWFNNVHVPEADILDRFGGINDRGAYVSPIKNVHQRFGIMVGGLTTGRLLIAQSALDAMKIGLTIAITYSSTRPQFGDKRILEYVTHQRRLFPGLAKVYAFNYAMKLLKNEALGPEKGSGSRSTNGHVPMDGKQLHVLSSCLKAAATWTRVSVLQDCRECCGGMGFLAANRIGGLLTDMNVDVTFEGDNTVLMQQVAKSLLETRNFGVQSVPQISGAAGMSNALNCDDTVNKLLHSGWAAIMKVVQNEVARDKTNGFDANLDLTLDIGWLYAEAHAHSAFIKALETAPSEHRELLSEVCKLYGACVVDKWSGTLLKAGAIDGNAASYTRVAVNNLCASLAEHDGMKALTLCRAFGLPDHIIQAPIAFDWRAIK